MDYSGEDIKIEFDLTMKHGENPLLVARLCSEKTIEKCVNAVTKESI